MQISSIVLYSHQGEKRVVKFELGKVNIITGRSKRGKSALIDIVDYCLGSESCNIAEGIISKSVSWYALHLRFNSSEMFIARKNPASGNSTSSEIYFEERNVISDYPVFPMQPNSTIAGMKSAIAAQIKMPENLAGKTNIPGVGKSPAEVGLRTTLAFCFQSNDEIASKNMLFHRQGETFVAQGLIEALPFILGALPDNLLRLQKDHQRAKKALSEALRELLEVEQLRGEGLTRGTSLFSEAKQVGLIQSDVDIPGSGSELKKSLQNSMNWVPELPSVSDLQRYHALKSKLNTLDETYQELTHRLAAANTFVAEEDSYVNELKSQELRLESIGLFALCADSSKCPLCNSIRPQSTTRIAKVRDAVTYVTQSLNSITQSRPQVSEYVQKLENELSVTKLELKKVSLEISGIENVLISNKSLKDRNLVVASTRGKIELWLESVKIVDDTSEYESRVADAKARLAKLEEQLALEEVSEKMISILNRINHTMTVLANQLKLEHVTENNPVHFNPKKLTIMVDGDGGSTIPLKRIGSAANILGFHLVTLFALHKHFIEAQRPVPNFLFLDQPSQVYYPSEKDIDETGSLNNISETDGDALKNLYQFIFETTSKLNGKMQIIILEHATVPTAYYEASTIETWRDEGKALIPPHWIK